MTEPNTELNTSNDTPTRAPATVAASVPPRPPRHQVVVIGSGFGGLFGTKALKRSDVDVTMIAKTTHHLFQPLLYQVATGILSEGEIAPPTREVLSGQKNARVLLGEVTDIDLEAQTVTSQVLGRETVTPYDSLLVAAGSSQSYFGNDHFAEFAPGMKSIDDALELRGRIFGAFELAELWTLAGRPVDHLLTFVVVGAGPTGVEMAGQIAELSRRTLKRDFRAISSRDARVVLVDAASQVLPPFGATLGEKTKRELEKLGVEVMLGAMVTDVDERGLEVKYKDGSTQRIEAVTKIWAAGVQANSLSKTLSEQTGAPLDRAGRIGVNPDLTLPGHPEVFVVGDMIALDHLPGVAQVAIQGAKYAATSIDHRLEGKPPQKPFKYFDKGSMATISRFRAVALIGKIRLSGFIAWLMWLVVHLFYVTGFKNRVTAVLHWGVSFLGRGRSERTATEQQIFGRQAMKRLERGVQELVSEPDDAGTEIGRLQEQRRAELEATALEEARLTDQNERGHHDDHTDQSGHSGGVSDEADRTAGASR
ncbi:NAD(P)/FAD-dependent oxidoreductase [Nocardioides flavescens]|uniref:NADH:ubiquinone reductase (non-electrogenic) n=1 Tax=Nocardioides flavescens TaxID=2691959 RepID=A0A6L7F067_9ACTN|nr:NAD(P)/FAD-dependent oxidoreductase [Nocardioides flavescens]MXG90149.1 NAD(P)/FAD-dependent oxidoreductase [Nocardioides flavescens]